MGSGSPIRWNDALHPDGTIDRRSPTGHNYTTRPGRRLLFPTLCLPTTSLPATAPPSDRGREVMMPTRKNTRAQDRLRCIEAERAHNLARRDRPPP
ncbi:hypothetical protein [Mycolicibacter heraklionensis]|uniref:hypothetical protein n=1 Tax=Mycolicibacter heraklionensis TaxID=512402 RepID=UPI001039C229|nr:hypothetical protein [Mycolicibacter heraklionensis]